MLQSVVPFVCRNAAALAVTASALALAATPASATVLGTLSFTTPTGIVGATDSIDIYLTLALDAASDDLITDENGRLLSGLDAGDFTDAGLDPDAVSGSCLNVFFQCGGNFDTLCNGAGAPYNVDFRFDGRNINVAAGGSYSFLYATFNPAAGAVAPGTYTFYNAALFGVPFDENGDAFTGPDGYDVTIVFDQTCPYPYSDTCAFTRTVEGVDAAVPEPSSWAMLITGFGAVGYAMRRRRIGYRFAQGV